MNSTDVLGNVQHYARLGSQNEARRAVDSTLMTLAERISSDEAAHLAAQLPASLATIVTQNRGSDRTSGSFDLDEFYKRVAHPENADLPDAVHHAKVVMSVVGEAMSPGQMEPMCATLPETYGDLFETNAMGDSNA